MAAVFDELEMKQEMIEGAIRKCTIEELKAILAGLTGNAVDAGATRIATLREIQAYFDEKTDASEKGAVFLRLIALVPATMAGRISDIVVKGQDSDASQVMNNLRAAGSSMDQSLEVAELMKTSALRKDFKIEGKLGRSKDSMSIITLKGQIAEGRRKGYTDEEICAAIKRAVVPGEMKTILDSKTDTSLVEILIFIESVLKEKSSSELFQSLSRVMQQDTEDPQSFLMRALELRQKCLLTSQKPGEVPYSAELVQTVFLKRIRIGLTNNAVKSRVETFIERNPHVDDSSLIQTMNQIASEEAERECMRVTASQSGTARLAAVSSATSSGAPDRQQHSSTTQDNGKQDIHQTVLKLAEQMSVLTQEMSKLHQTATNQPLVTRNSGTTQRPNFNRGGGRGGGNYGGGGRFGSGGGATSQPSGQAGQGYRWYACEECIANNRQRSCRHCLECGQLGHPARDCPTLN